MSKLELISNIFEVCIFPLLGILTAYLVSFIKVKRDELIKNTANLENAEHKELLDKYINLAESTVTKCVLATNQTFVDSLKNKGEFTKDAWQEAFNLTYDSVKAILGDEAQIYLAEAVGDVQIYLKNLIEAEVLMNKK